MQICGFSGICKCKCDNKSLPYRYRGEEVFHDLAMLLEAFPANGGSTSTMGTGWTLRPYSIGILPARKLT